MDDKLRLEEQALRWRRLIGMLLHGARWRERPARPPLNRLLVGLLLGAIACALIAGGSFVADQLSRDDDRGGGFGAASQQTPVTGGSGGNVGNLGDLDQQRPAPAPGELPAARGDR